MSQAMNIGEAAEAAGVSAKMIRHYEQIGLIPAAARTESGYRQYTDQDVSVLRFVRKARQLGFSMDQIAELLGLWSDRRRASRKVKALAQSHLRALEEKLHEIAEMQKALKRLVVSCHGNDDPHCAIIDGLATRSPSAPSVAPARLKPPPAPHDRSSATQAPKPKRTDAHADLMAWTRGARLGSAQRH